MVVVHSFLLDITLTRLQLVQARHTGDGSQLHESPVYHRSGRAAPLTQNSWTSG